MSVGIEFTGSIWGAILGGVLLPASTLTTPWFGLLATVVAFNTLIYVGLTMSKVIPWPRQFRPAKVRTWLAMRGFEIEVDSSVKTPTSGPSEGKNPYDEMRLDVARRDIPMAFALAGALILLFSVVSLFTREDGTIPELVVILATGTIFLGASLVLGRRQLRARALIWAWALGCTAIVTILTVQAILINNPIQLAYGLIFMVGFAPVTLAWRPFLCATAIMLIDFVVYATLAGSLDAVRIVVASLAALMFGAVLLRIRLVSITALSDEKARSEALASTDVLTGLLSRYGLMTLVPVIAGNAEQTGEQVRLLSVDVVDLATANERYGTRYGDEVIRAVARAVKASAAAGDLVSRSGGDEFLIVGLGDLALANRLIAPINDRVTMSTVSLGKAPVRLRAGAAAGDPRVTTFDNLLAAASRASDDLIDRAVSCRTPVIGHELDGSPTMRVWLYEAEGGVLTMRLDDQPWLLTANGLAREGCFGVDADALADLTRMTRLTTEQASDAVAAGQWNAEVIDWPYDENPAPVVACWDVGAEELLPSDHSPGGRRPGKSALAYIEPAGV